MCYAWVARFLQDCSKIVSIHSKAIHVYYSFSLIFTCAMHKIVAGVLQDDCNVVVGLLPDCWHKFKYNTKKAWSRLLQDCYKIIARLLQERCKINSWSNNFLRETQHNLTLHNLTSHLKCSHLFKAWSSLLQDCYNIVATRLLQDCCKNVVKSMLSFMRKIVGSRIDFTTFLQQSCCNNLTILQQSRSSFKKMITF